MNKLTKYLVAAVCLIGMSQLIQVASAGAWTIGGPYNGRLESVSVNTHLRWQPRRLRGRVRMGGRSRRSRLGSRLPVRRHLDHHCDIVFAAGGHNLDPTENIVLGSVNPTVFRSDISSTYPGLKSPAGFVASFGLENAPPSGKMCATAVSSVDGLHNTTSLGCQPYTKPRTSSPMVSMWSGSRSDNFTTATSAGISSGFAAGYQKVRTEGWVFPTQQPGTVPLKLYWSSARISSVV